MGFDTSILINNTVSDITLESFGSIVVPASSQLDVSQIIYLPELRSSAELEAYITAEDISINDGFETYTGSQAFNYLKNYNLVERVVTVGTGGAVMYTSIQDAIDSITVGADEKYTIKIAPGIYEENIVMKNGVRLDAAGSKGDVEIKVTSGTTLTVTGGLTRYKGIKFTVDSTSSSTPKCIAISGGNHTFDSCLFNIVVSGSFLTGIDISGGYAGFDTCSFLYTQTGVGGGEHLVISNSSTGTFAVQNGRAIINVAAISTSEYVLFAKDIGSSTSTKRIAGLDADITATVGSFDGHIGFWKVTGDTKDNQAQSNTIHVQSSSAGGSSSVAYAYDVDSSGGDAEIHSVSNYIRVEGFNENFFCEVDGNDQVMSHFDDIIAPDKKAGTGTYLFVNSPSDGNLEISGSYLNMYDSAVTVGAKGGDFTLIQDAIDSITDASISRTYVILVYPGTYTENIDFTGKPYINLKGIGTRTDCIITAASGTTLTVDDGSPFECVNMTLQNTAASGGKVVVIPAGLNYLTDTIVFSNCAIRSIINNGYGTTIEQSSGRLVNIGGRIQYIHSGTGGGDHKLIDIIAGDSAVVSKAQLHTMSISSSASADNVVMINEANAAVVISCFSLIASMVRSGTVTGTTDFYIPNGTGTDKVFIANNITMLNSGSGGTGNALKTAGNGCTVKFLSNRIAVTGFTTNYAFNVAASDTVYSTFDFIETADNKTVAGTFYATHAHDEGDFFVTRDLYLERNMSISGNLGFATGTTVNEISTTVNTVTPDDDTLITEKALTDYTSGLASLYVRQDGTTPFTGTQTGVSPTLGSHLATKTYVDAAVSGGGENDLGPFISRTVSDPPANPSNGDKYIVPEQTSDSSNSEFSEFSESSGLSWEGKDNEVAEWNAVDERWDFTTPVAGNYGWVNDEGQQYIFDGDEWISVGTNISHTALQDIGTNTHVQIDSHIASTLNPHSVTNTQVGLGNVTDDSQLKRAAGDFVTFTEKLTAASADVVLIEDSADSNNKKRMQLTNLPDEKVKISATDTTTDYLENKLVGTTDKITVTKIGGGGDEDLQVGLGTDLVTLTDGSNADALHAHAHSSTTGQTTDDHHNQSHAFAGVDHTSSTKANVDSKISDASLISTLGAEINAIISKATPIGADVALIEDSAASYDKKKVLLSALPVNAHLLGGTSHTADTKANLDTKVSDASLFSTLPGEISTLTEKITTAGADLVLIEDSAATNAKKKVQITNLLSGLDRKTDSFSNVWTNTVQTTSATPVLMTATTITPTAGTWLVYFSGLCTNSGKNTNFIQIYSNTTAVAGSLRATNIGAVNAQATLSTQAIVTTTGTQVINAYWYTTTGTASCTQRSLILIRVQSL